MIKAIIFDLDNCLAAADEPGPQLLEPTFEAIRRANHGTLPDEALERALDECWRHPLDYVARTHGFSDEMLAAGWAVNARAEVQTAMRGYPDLGALAALPARLFLVTSGFRRLQESKVRALGLESRFERVYVDAIDESDRKGKEGIFADILRSYALDAAEVLVVGDNADSEIAAGNRLGIPTVQILRDEVPRARNATYHVHSLVELHDLLRPVAAPAPLTVELLPEPLSVCRLAADAAVPEWAMADPGAFCSVTRTADELSVICATRWVPTRPAPAALTAREDGWRALKLVGPFALSEVGVLLRVAAPLAAAGISILPVATFETDYVLVPESRLPSALAELRGAGHTVARGAD